MLVADDQLVQQPGFLTLEACSNGEILLPDRLLLTDVWAAAETWANNDGTDASAFILFN